MSWFKNSLYYLKRIKEFWKLSSFKAELIKNLVIGLSIYILIVNLHDIRWVMNTQDEWMDWMMEISTGIVPSTENKNIPPFVYLDINDETYYTWDEPLFIPRKRLKYLIENAVRAKARLIIVDIDVSQSTPVEYQSLYSEDKDLKKYLEQYVTTCKEKAENPKQSEECPKILFVRAFSTQEYDVAPIPRTGFLEPIITEGAPYLYWVSAHFYRSPDLVVRRWKLWQDACLNNQPQVVPSVELLAMAIIKNNCSVEHVYNALTPFKPQSCSSDEADENVSSPVLPEKSEMITFCEGDNLLQMSTGVRDINQRIMYSMPWGDDEEQPPDSLPYFVTTQTGEPILTIESAKFFAESWPGKSLETLTGSIVIIGGSYRDGRDIHMTPIGYIPGALIITNAIHSLLEYKKLEPVPYVGGLITVGLIIFLSLLLARFRRSLLKMLIAGGILIAVIVPIGIILFSYGIWLDFVIPLIVVELYQILEEVQNILAGNIEQ